jgi:hypothetical protein
MVFSRLMRFTDIFMVVAVVSVLCTVWWILRDWRMPDERRWQASVWGIAALSFILLSLCLWLFATLTAGFSCDDACGSGRGVEWTDDSEASQWDVMFFLGSSIPLLALATVATLRFRRHAAALLCMLAYILVSVQLGLLLVTADGRETWSWLLWPTAAGLIMLFAARGRDGLSPVPLLRRPG